MSNDNVFAPALLDSMGTLTRAVSETEKSARTTTKVVDSLHSLGFMAFMCKAPKAEQADNKYDVGGVDSTHKALFELAKASVVDGMPAKSRELIKADPKDVKNWDAELKAARRKAQQAIGAYMARLGKSLARLEGDTTKPTKTDQEKLVTYINSVYTLLMKEGVDIDANYNEVVKATRQLAKVAGIKELKADTK